MCLNALANLVCICVVEAQLAFFGSQDDKLVAWQDSNRQDVGLF
jgi:hypothetical protein